jgi:hypothetical protein
MPNDARFNLRLDAETHTRFNAAACRLRNTSRARIVRDLLNAAADYIDTWGDWFPFRLEPLDPYSRDRRTIIYPRSDAHPPRAIPRTAEPPNPDK